MIVCPGDLVTFDSNKLFQSIGSDNDTWLKPGTVVQVIATRIDDEEWMEEYVMVLAGSPPRLGYIFYSGLKIESRYGVNVI
jgi:hypothetical protein